MNKLRLLRGEDFLDYPGGSSVITRVLIKGKHMRRQGGREGERLRFEDVTLTGFNDEGWDHEPKNFRQLLEAGKGEEMNFPIEPLEEM